MRVFTPNETARRTGSKYLGLLVAAKYARELNALPADAVPDARGEKLTTRALETVADSEIQFTLSKRRPRGG
jgi:DNA-directed RNA polymerase omega subunit